MVLEDESQDSILDLAFSPDSTLLASAEVYDPENAVSIWDLSSGTLAQRLVHHRNAVAAVAFSPDGSILATGSLDNTIVLWDAESWKPMLELVGHRGQVRTLTFSPEGEYLASGGSGGLTFVWNILDGTILYRFPQAAGDVRRVSFSPDGQFLAVASGETVLRIWRLEDGTLAQTVTGRGNIHEIAYSSSGQHIATSSLTWMSDPPYDPVVRLAILDLDREEEVAASSQPEAAYRLAFSLDETVLFAASSQNLIRAWDPIRGNLLHEFNMHSGRLPVIAVSPDGTTVAVGSQTGHIMLYGLHETRSAGTYELLGLGCLENNQMVIGFKVPSGIKSDLSAKVNQKPYPCEMYPAFLNRAYCYGPRISEEALVLVQLFIDDDESPAVEEETSGISCIPDRKDKQDQAKPQGEVRYDCALADLCISCGNVWVEYDPVKDERVCNCYPVDEQTVACVVCALNPDDPMCTP